MQQVEQAEGDAFELQCAAFDAREVEDVIDDFQQVFSGLGGQGGIFGLLLSHFSGFQQLQHAQHAIHWGSQLVAHHCQEVRFGAVGQFRLLARLNQQGHGSLLFFTGAGQAVCEVVDMPRQRLQLAFTDFGQGSLVVAGLNRADGFTHGAQWLRQVACQAAGKNKGQGQGKQCEQGGLEEDFLLACIESVIRHTNDNIAQVVISQCLLIRSIWRSTLQVDGRLKHIDLAACVAAAGSLFDVNENFTGVITHFQEAHVWGFQRGLQQCLEHLKVAGNHPVGTGWG